MSDQHMTESDWVALLRRKQEKHAEFYGLGKADPPIVPRELTPADAQRLTEELQRRMAERRS
jgi:hypothetical protein